MITDIVPLLQFIKHVPCIVSIPGHCVAEVCPQPLGLCYSESFEAV